MIPNDSFKQNLLLHQSTMFASLPRFIVQMRIDLLSGTMPDEATFKQYMPNNNMKAINEISQQMVNAGAVRHGFSQFANNSLLHSGVGFDWKKRVLDLSGAPVDVTVPGTITHMLIQFSQSPTAIVAGSTQVAYAFLLTVSDLAGDGEMKMKSPTVVADTRIRLTRLVLDFTPTITGGNP